MTIQISPDSTTRDGAGLLRAMFLKKNVEATYGASTPTRTTPGTSSTDGSRSPWWW